MRIFYKLITGFMIVAMLTVAVAYVGVSSHVTISDSYNLVKEAILVTDSLEKMNVYTYEKTHLYTKLIVSENSTPEEYELLKEKSEEFDSSLNKYEERVKKFFPSEMEFLEKINSASDRVEKSGREIMEMKRSGIPATGSKEFEEFNAAQKELMENIDKALEQEQEEFNERTENLNLVIESSINSILVVSLIALILSMVIGAAISISISRPMIRLKDAADEIRKGKLDTAVEIRSNDETGILSDAFNKMVRSLSHEIEEHKRAEDELKMTGEQISIMIESLPLIPYTCRAEGDFEATYISKSVTRIAGYQPEDFTSNPSFWADNIHPEDKQKVFAELPRLFENGEYYHEYRWKVSDGSYKVFGDTLRLMKTPDGKISHIIGTWQDITERKLALEALEQSEEKFRTLFDNATDGIMLADLETKKQYMANKKICKMLGYSLEEILNLSAMDLHPEKDMPWIMEMFEKQASGEISLIENIPVKRKDGTVFYADINTSPVNIGGKSYNLGIFRDITERRRNEDMRRDNERLAIANRAKSEFLTVMSHELRTPLNAIIGFSELLNLKDAGGLNEKQQRYNENVLTSGKLLLRIIDDLLDLTKVESGKMDLLIEHVPVAAAVNEVLETIKENARKQKIIVKIDLKPEIEFIDTDGQKFKQVLNNLLSNAVKFRKHEGGTITITAVKEGDMAKFSVSDTGIGIKEEDMGRMFHSFEQLDSGIARKYGGTGLGLAVSKKLVEMLGGTITAQSKYGEGSTFTFMLPIEAKKREDT